MIDKVIDLVFFIVSILFINKYNFITMHCACNCLIFFFWIIEKSHYVVKPCRWHFHNNNTNYFHEYRIFRKQTLLIQINNLYFLTGRIWTQNHNIKSRNFSCLAADIFDTYFIHVYKTNIVNTCLNNSLDSLSYLICQLCIINTSINLVSLASGV